MHHPTTNRSYVRAPDPFQGVWPAPGGRHTRVLVAVAHPDDEAWIFGGAIAALTAAGADVDVYCASDGEAAPRGASNDPKPAELCRSKRAAELQEAAARLGVRQVHRGRHPDGALADHAPSLRRDLHDALDRLRPVVVFTHDPHGDYGHPDHAAVFEATRMVCRDAWNTAQAPFPHLAVPAWPPGLFCSLRRHLTRARLPLEPVPPDLSPGHMLTLPPGPWHATQANALSAHASQLRRPSPEDFLQPGLCGRWWAETRFRWTHP